jgi:subtilisin family serine protease
MTGINIKTVRVLRFSAQILLILLFLMVWVSAQKKIGNRAQKRMQIEDEVKLATDRYLENEVCKGRGLFKSSRILRSREVEIIETLFKESDFPVRINRVSNDNIYLFQGVNKNAETERLFQIFFELQNKSPNLPGLDGVFEPDFLIRGDMAPESKTITYSRWGVDVIGAPQAWHKYGENVSQNQVVAVLDSGMSAAHPALTRNVWRSPKKYTAFPTRLGQPVECDLPDSYGFNFLGGSGTTLKQFCQPPDGTSNSHGTSVSGIIGSSKNFDSNVAGVAQQIGIVQVKVLNKDGMGCICDAIQGIDFVTYTILPIVKGQRKEIRIINASFVTDPNIVSTLLETAVRNAADKDILIISAAGNDSVQDISITRYYPASYSLPIFKLPNVVGVAASGRAAQPKDEMLLGSSNRGRAAVQLAAPGSSVGTLMVGGGYHGFSRTSAATPFVSASAALVMGVCPKLKNAEVLNVLFMEANKTSPYIIKHVRDGRLNVFEAMNRAIRNPNCK